MKVDLFLKKWIGRHNIVPIVISLVALVLSYYTLIQIEKYSQPIEPDLIITTDYDDLTIRLPVFYTWELTKFRSGEDQGKLELCIHNKGRMETGHIHFKISDNYLDSSDGNIITIESTKTECDAINVRQKNCVVDCTKGKCIYENCNETILPLGPLPLKIDFECRNCISSKFPKEFSQTINVCISNGSREICY